MASSEQKSEIGFVKKGKQHDYVVYLNKSLYFYLQNQMFFQL